jgi:MFS family permease
MIGDPLGRKNSILLGTTIMSIGALLQCTAFGVPQMIVGRVVAGIGNGINTSTAPVWQGETSKASWRGKLVIIEMIMNIAGFSLSNWVTWLFISRRWCFLAYTTCSTIPFYLHPLRHCTMVARVTSLAHQQRPCGGGQSYPCSTRIDNS